MRDKKGREKVAVVKSLVNLNYVLMCGDKVLLSYSILCAAKIYC